MRTIEEIKEIIKNSIVGGNQWEFKPNLTETQLLELREAVKDGQELKGKTNDEEFERLIKIRAYGCWTGGINIALEKMVKKPINKKYGFKFDNLKIEAEKPNKIIAYKEPTFTPNETEADYNISTSDDMYWGNYGEWEIEEYNKKEAKRERENMRDDNYYFESKATSSRPTTITSQQIINQQAQRIRELEAQLARLQLENKQKVQIEQPPKK